MAVTIAACAVAVAACNAVLGNDAVSLWESDSGATRLADSASPADDRADASLTDDSTASDSDGPADGPTADGPGTEREGALQGGPDASLDGSQGADDDGGGRDAGLEGSVDAAPDGPGPSCSAGAKRCNGNVPQTCSGGTWTNGVVCDAYCASGACVNPPSCSGGLQCGASSASCCSAGAIPGGTFSRSYDAVTSGATDPSYKATIAPFLLDTYEVTVARFQAYVAAYPGDLPVAGTGKDPSDPNDPGWTGSWNTSALPASQGALESALACDTTATWSTTPGTNLNKPINCVTWYLAQAFCIWDGGRLPTEAEWNYAATGGGGSDGQRVYPWSNPPGSQSISTSDAVYTPASLADVGTKSPAGDGKWGQADLAGNVGEWVIDWYASPYTSTACDNCADFSAAMYRVLRGGSFETPASLLTTSYRTATTPSDTKPTWGFRCARAQ